MKNKTKDQLWSLNAAQPVGDLNSKSGVLSPGTPETPGWGPRGMGTRPNGNIPG